MFRIRTHDLLSLEKKHPATEITLPYNLNTLYLANEVTNPEKDSERDFIRQVFIHTAHQVERRRSWERSLLCGVGALAGCLVTPKLGHLLGTWPNYIHVPVNVSLTATISFVSGFVAYAVGRPEFLSIFGNRFPNASFNHKYSDLREARGDKEVCLRTQELLDKKCSFGSRAPS